jgi:hypothetical protein
MSEQPSIYGRMAAVLADVVAIEKTRKNQAQGFQFRGIDDVMNELHGTFAKHSLFLTHEVLEHAMTERETRNGGKSFHHIAKVRFTFWAPDGSSVQATGVGEAADTGDKGAGKAMAYALKVCLLQTFLIPTEEEKDPDYRVTEWAKPAPIPVAKKAAPVAKPAAQPPAEVKVAPGLLTDGYLEDEPENKPSGGKFQYLGESKVRTVAEDAERLGLTVEVRDIWPLFVEGRDNAQVKSILAALKIPAESQKKHRDALKSFLTETIAFTDLRSATEHFFMENR